MQSIIQSGVGGGEIFAYHLNLWKPFRRKIGEAFFVQIAQVSFQIMRRDQTYDETIIRIIFDAALAIAAVEVRCTVVFPFIFKYWKRLSLHKS